MTEIPLEPSSAERVALGGEVVKFLDDWIARRGETPASWPEPDGDLIDELLTAPGERGRKLPEEGAIVRVKLAATVGKQSYCPPMKKSGRLWGIAGEAERLPGVRMRILITF